MEAKYGAQYVRLYREHWWWRAREAIVLDLLRRCGRGRVRRSLMWAVAMHCRFRRFPSSERSGGSKLTKTCSTLPGHSASGSRPARSAIRFTMTRRGALTWSRPSTSSSISTMTGRPFPPWPPCCGRADCWSSPFRRSSCCGTTTTRSTTIAVGTPPDACGSRSTAKGWNSCRCDTSSEPSSFPSSWCGSPTQSVREKWPSTASQGRRSMRP